MNGKDKTTPPASSPEPEDNRGYADENPRDKQDARQPDPRPHPNPDDGGLDRDPAAGSADG